MKLSILDQAPIAEGMTAGDALQASKELAQLGDRLGYTRYWIAEHHNMPSLACSAPEIMLGYLGAHTKRIRIGSGAVLLPYYKPYKVAETYHMLATLFPGRIDVGIGRAPGGSAEATMALSDHYLEKVYKLPELIDEFLHYIDQDTLSEHRLTKVAASPIPLTPPEPWLLGTSAKSAQLAAEKGLSYAFGQFMSENNGMEIIEKYTEQFQARKYSSVSKQTTANYGTAPKSLLTVNVICAETEELADDLSLSPLLWQIQQAKGEFGKGVPTVEEAKKYLYSKTDLVQIQELKDKMIIGNPESVSRQLMTLKSQYMVDEIMLNTVTHSYKARLRSYQLIAQEILGT